MAFIECAKSELDLFTAHPMQNSILKTEEVSYKPLASLDNSSVIEFSSLGHGDTYRDLSSLYLKLKLQMFKNTKDESLTENGPGVVNNILHSLFRQCTIYLNGKPIAQTDNNYSYRAYMENLLNYGNDAASTHLESVGWHIDNGPMDFETPAATTTAGTTATAAPTRRKRIIDVEEDEEMIDPPTIGRKKRAGETSTAAAGVSNAGASTSTTEKDEENTGLTKRTKIFEKSCVVEIMGKIHGDLFNQSKLLLNNVDLRVVLSTEKPEFYIMSKEKDDQSYIKIIDATLYLNHVTLNQNVLLSHQSVLQKRNAVYPYKRVEVKTYTIPANSSSLLIDNIVIGQLPNLLVFGMVDNDAYTGNRAKNPFNFKHNNITTFNLSVNGVQVPNQPIQFDYSNMETPISTRGYLSLFKGTGIHFFDRGHQITKKFFDNGCFLLAFDLTTDISNNSISCTNLLNQGTVRVEGRFKEALKNTITCIVYAEYDASIEIDSNRNIFTSF
jgi:hypothetical protein